MSGKHVYQFTNGMLEEWGLPLEVGKWYVSNAPDKGDTVADIYQAALYSEGPYDSREEATRRR